MNDEMHSPGSHEPSPLLGVGLMALVYLIPVIWAVSDFGDPDLWWHLRTGQWVVEHRTVPTTEPFSIGGAEEEWVAYSWLFEIAIYRIYQAFGLVGIQLYRVVMALLILAACHRLITLREHRCYFILALLGLSGLVLSPLLHERPWLLTILFALITQLAVQQVREGGGRWSVWLLPLVYVLWANIHIQFVYGFVLLGIGTVAAWWEYRTNGSERPAAERGGSEARWKLLVLTLLCMGATLMNPYHVRLYKVVWEYASQRWAFEVVSELTALDFRYHWDWIALGFALLSAYAIGRRGRRVAYDALLLGVSAFLCFRARRDLWMVVIAGLAILPGMALPVGMGRAHFLLSLRRGAAVLSIVCAGVVFLFWASGSNNANLEAQVARKYPQEATEVIRKKGIHGRLYNHFDWGGYLIWRLPHHRVVIDGRTNLHGEVRVRDSLRTWHGLPGWREDDNLAQADVVIGPASAALASLLKMDPRFEILYEDVVAIIFRRSRKMQE